MSSRNGWTLIDTIDEDGNESTMWESPAITVASTDTSIIGLVAFED